MSVPFYDKPFPRPWGEDGRRLVVAAKYIADRFFMACDETGSGYEDLRHDRATLYNRTVRGYATRTGLYLVSNGNLPTFVITPWGVYEFHGSGFLATASTSLLNHPTFRTGLDLDGPRKLVQRSQLDVFPVLQAGTAKLPRPDLYTTGWEQQSELEEEWTKFFPRS